MIVLRPDAGNFGGCSVKILGPVVGGRAADPEDRDRVTGVSGNDEICSARATAGLSLLDGMDCLGLVVDSVQQVDDMLDIFDTHFVQASVDSTRQGESVDTSSICENIAGDMCPGGHGGRQADETSTSLVNHFGQASETSIKVAESGDSGDIGDNIANSKEVACRAFNFNSASNLSVLIAINGVSMTAILDTGAQVTVVIDTFVWRHLAGLKFGGGGGACNLNGIKSDAPVTASQSEEVEFTIGDSSYRWKFLKAAITDNCILGLDFIAHFTLDIKLSENTLALGNSTIPIQVLAMQAKGSYAVNTVSLFKKFKILPYSGLKFFETEFQVSK